MKKIRVYEAAKEFHVSSEALLETLRGLGVEVKSHMSSIDDDVVARLKQKFNKDVEAAREEMARVKEKEAARVRAAAAAAAAAAPPAPPRPSQPRPASAPQAGAHAPRPAQPSRPGGPPRPQGPSSQRPGGPSGSPRPGGGGPGGPRPGFGGPQAGGPQRGPARGGRLRGAKKKKRVVDERLVAENVKRTLASLDAGARGHAKHRRERGEGTAVEEDAKVLQVTEFITVADLAGQMEVKPQEVIAACMRLGVMVTINRRLDKDTIEAVADEFGYGVEFVSEYSTEAVEEAEDVPADTTPRAPVVTVMGHVDHGKTTLLDYIRRASVAAGETGGITQHISAYSASVNGKPITFLDTPGHEAFTSMRARGAQVTDIVVLVVAADDRVMPQTIEAIDHARAAGVPIIVAINKVDLPVARPDLVMADLTKHKLVAEEYGGDTIMVPVSAKKGTGVERLLEMILLKAEMMELKANPDRRGKGTVVEARKEPGRGTVVAVLVQNGTVRVGDAFVAGTQYGKVRALTSRRGDRISEAGPSVPVEITGFSGVPSAGDTFQVLADEREAREIATKRHQLQREQEQRAFHHLTLADISQRVKEGGAAELRLIIKADVDGSAEALSDHLGRLGSDEVKLRIIHSGVGNISESDVLLAAASDAVILGFRVPVESSARSAAAREKVDVRGYEIIYKAEEDIKAAMSGLLKPEIRETILGRAEVRKVFHLSKSGSVAGCFVASGNILRNAKARLMRGGASVFDGRVGALKRFKDDVREVATGYECGITLEGYSDYREGDIIEAYELEEVARTLA
ncbi:MAG: translation initiation factor IF-2 [Candidatus Eisenbacteria bacterium]|nr:translation initiation factor IF-2 [Candidatus Eisenbacteria bacterium]